MSDRKPTHVAYGWGAPSIIEQFPNMPAKAAEAFDADGKAVVRLHIRGVIAERERDRALARLTKAIERELLAPSPPPKEA